MKKVIYKFVTIFIIFISNYSFSQPGWIWQNPLPHGNNINLIKFIDTNTGWYFSNIAKNYKTTNGGIDWVIESLPTTNSIFAARVYKFDSLYNTYWLAGDSGIILKSTNSGINWIIMNSPINSTITDIYFINSNLGYLAASNLYRTTDGGNNWSVSISALDTYIRSIFFLNDSIGWVARDNSFFQSSPYSYYAVSKTTNSGNNWNQIYSNNVLGTFSHFLNIFFKDKNNGFARFDFQYKSSNSGNSWAYISYNNIFDFINSNTGFATGQNKFLRTTNFGDNWIITDSILIKKIIQNCIESINSNITYVGGLYGNLMKTNDGGYNWNNITKSVTRNDITSVFAADSLNLFALAPNKSFLKSTNSGNNWILTDSLLWNNYNLKSLFFINKDYGWLGASNGRIYKTINGGNNWSFIDLQTSNYIKSIKFFSSGTGYLLDSINRIYRTTNMGNNWNFILKLNDTIKDFTFPDQTTGYAFTKKSIYKSNNSGSNWSIIHVVNLNQTICNLEFYNSMFGCIIVLSNIPSPPYSSYSTYYTTNGGINWTISYSTPSDDSSKIYFVNQNIFYISFGTGSISLTTNGGINWTRQQIANSNINSITNYKKDIWVAGDNGIILKGNQIVPIGIRQISKIVPSEFSLSQNYPNPFNPTTTISYKVKSYQVIRLAVYNILGKEVAVLVNEKLQPGEYEVQFPNEQSANVQLPSGVYFYSLYADGNLIEIKKMVLIK